MVCMKPLLTFVIAAFLATSASAAVTVEVTLGGRTLDVRKDGQLVGSYQISTGLPNHPTPTGSFSIRRIVWNPAWVPPKEPWAKGKKATPPAHPKNPLKVVKMFFKEPDYYIHGTADEKLLGDPASHGCIRMSAADAYTLARLLMDNSGAAKPASWYQTAISGSKSVTVRLPKAVPVKITK